MRVCSALITGVIAGVVTCIPLWLAARAPLEWVYWAALPVCLCGGGLLSAWLYRRFEGRVTAACGALSGSLGGALAGLLYFVGLVLRVQAASSTGISIRGGFEYVGTLFETTARVWNETMHELPGYLRLTAGQLAALLGVPYLAMHAALGAVGGLVGPVLFRLCVPRRKWQRMDRVIREKDLEADPAIHRRKGIYDG